MHRNAWGSGSTCGQFKVSRRLTEPQTGTRVLWLLNSLGATRAAPELPSHTRFLGSRSSRPLRSQPQGNGPGRGGSALVWCYSGLNLTQGAARPPFPYFSRVLKEEMTNDLALWMNIYVEREKTRENQHVSHPQNPIISSI